MNIDVSPIVRLFPMFYLVYEQWCFFLKIESDLRNKTSVHVFYRGIKYKYKFRCV